MSGRIVTLHVNIHFYGREQNWRYCHPNIVSCWFWLQSCVSPVKENRSRLDMVKIGDLRLSMTIDNVGTRYQKVVIKETVTMITFKLNELDKMFCACLQILFFNNNTVFFNKCMFLDVNLSKCNSFYFYLFQTYKKLSYLLLILHMKLIWGVSTSPKYKRWIG